MRNLLQSMSGVQLRLLWDRNIFMVVMSESEPENPTLLDLVHRKSSSATPRKLRLMSTDNYNTTPTPRTLPPNKYVCIQLTRKQACYYVVN